MLNKIRYYLYYYEAGFSSFLEPYILKYLYIYNFIFIIWYLNLKQKNNYYCIAFK